MTANTICILEIGNQILYSVFCTKAIRDGKYLAPPHASAWQRSPHQNLKCWFLFVTSFVRSLEFLYCLSIELTKRFPYLKEIVAPVFDIYAIELYGVP